MMGMQIPAYWWEANDLPVPTAEFQFDPQRRWRFDYAWPGRLNVALEIEGGVWTRGRHVRGVGYLRDMEKYNRAVELGWRVLRYPPNRINVEQLRRILA
jgi:hypothetical protein